MRDIYLYDDCPVLINKLGIKEQKLLDDAEADYVSYRLRELAIHPLKGKGHFSLCPWDEHKGYP